MCVIMCYEDDFPKLETLKSAEDMNSDGGGMAWISQKDGYVHWQKGITADQMMDLIKQKNIQLPIIIHFRIATVGGSGKELTHPFPVNDEAHIKTKGKAKSVLFHNGTWTEWRKTCLKTIVQQKIEFPRGYWSDSRALAWLTNRYGSGFLNLVTSSKIALLTKAGIERYSDGWTTVDGATCSNSTFDRVYSYQNNNTTNFSNSETETTNSFSNYDDDQYNPYGYWVKGIWTAYTKSEKEKIRKRRMNEDTSNSKEEDSTKNKQLKLSQKIDKEVEETKNKRTENELDNLKSVDTVIEKETKKYGSIEEFQDVFDNINDEIIAKEYDDSQDNRKQRYIRQLNQTTKE